VAEEAPQQLRVSGETAAFAAHVGLDVVDGVGREVREAPVLEVGPEQLHGVEFRRVGREPHDVAARMGRQPRAHELVLMGTAAIPDQDDWSAHVPREVAEKPKDLRTANVQARVQRQGEGELAAAGRDDERANAGDLFMGAGAHRQRRRGAARRPRAAEDRQHEEAGFIKADQVSAEAGEFFLPGTSPAESTRARGDRPAPSRAVGGAVA